MHGQHCTYDSGDMWRQNQQRLFVILNRIKCVAQTAAIMKVQRRKVKFNPNERGLRGL